MFKDYIIRRDHLNSYSLLRGYLSSYQDPMINSHYVPNSTGKPKISIGMPVFNEERFIRKKINSLLDQTYANFELIISDNASTDTTSSICEEYSKKEKRIRYIRQQKNMGMYWNYDFVLQEARGEYFMWAAPDDVVLPDFLEKNIKILESKKEYVGSVSKIESYIPTDRIQSDKIDSVFRNFRKKLRITSKYRGVYPITGDYEKKIRFYLTRSTCQIIYGVFRTDKLKLSKIDKIFVGIDWAKNLNILKYGDLNVVDEVLMYEFEEGMSSKGIINTAKLHDHGVLGIIFPWYTFTSWFLKNLGLKAFIKNLDYLIFLNLEGEFSIVVDLIQLLLHKHIKK